MSDSKTDNGGSGAGLSTSPPRFCSACPIITKVAEIADDFHPDNIHDAPLALQEMRDALMNLVENDGRVSLVAALRCRSQRLRGKARTLAARSCMRDAAYWQSVAIGVDKAAGWIEEGSV